MMDTASVTLPWVFIWATVSVLGLIVGALIGITDKLSHRVIAITMAVAAGLLLATAVVELAVEASEKFQTPVAAYAMMLGGAAVFCFFNALLARAGARDRKRCGMCVAQPTEASRPGSGTAILVGTALDAIPEALVLGASLSTQGLHVGLLVAIMLGNLPEAVSGSAGMRHASRSRTYILGVWGGVAAGGILLTVVGYLLASTLNPLAVASLQMLGAGALVAMVVETLVPEAVDGSPRFSGLMVVAGFSSLLLLAEAIN